MQAADVPGSQLTHDSPIDLERRTVLLASTALALGLTLSPGSIWAAARNAKAKPPHPQHALLNQLCDLVIPATDTPGARAAGVAAFVENAVAHGLRNAPVDLLPSFAAALDEFAKGRYVTLPVKQRIAVLTDIDTRTMQKTDNPITSPALAQWPMVKALIVVGYYTSEIGSSQELQYILIPGRFDPDVPYKPGDRAWSNDWTGVKYA